MLTAIWYVHVSPKTPRCTIKSLRCTIKYRWPLRAFHEIHFNVRIVLAEFQYSSCRVFVLPHVHVYETIEHCVNTKIIAKMLFISRLTLFCADPKLLLVFVDDFRAKTWFSVRERYVSCSNLLIVNLHLYVVIFHINMCC